MAGPEGLRLRVERAKIAARENYFLGPKELMVAVRMLIRRWGCAGSPDAVLARLMGDLKMRRDLGSAIRDLLSEDAIDGEAWDRLVRPLIAAIKSAAGCAASPNAMSFAAWRDIEGAPADRHDVRDARAAQVDVQTIHSVKGENHDATLVLETRVYDFDVPQALRAMVAKEVDPKLSDRATMHRRRMFVAMSRPRALLSMAAAAAHVDADLRAALETLGWEVLDLTTAAERSARAERVASRT